MATPGILLESEVHLAEDYLHSFFQQRPTDRRFQQVKFMQYFPLNSLSGATQMTFLLPRYTGPNIYLAHELMLEVSVKLTTDTGGQIPKEKQVAPINNILHSLFKVCRIYLGETLIARSSENYHLKSYIIDLLSFDAAAKYSWMFGQGWALDTAGYFEKVSLNVGFASRNKLFRMNQDRTKDYRTDAVTFVAKLHSDLRSSEVGIPPGLGMRVELDYSPAEFVLQTAAGDTGKYKIEITRAKLHCPVGELSKEMFQKIQNRLLKEPARIYLDRVEVTHKNIPQNSKNPVEHLFPGATLPSKLILGILPTKSFNGTFNTTPYKFSRSFGQCPTDVEEEASGSGRGQRKRKSKGKGPGKGKRSGGILGYLRNRKTRGEPDGADGNNEYEDEADDVTDNDDEEGDDDDDDDVPAATPDQCFLESVILKLNGSSVDGYDNIATEDQDMQNFMRLHHYLGFTSSRTGNNLTLNEFLKGSFFLVYDLTSSSQSSMVYAVPATLTGTLQLEMNFSCPTPTELTLIMYGEYPSLLEVDKNLQVSKSY